MSQHFASNHFASNAFANNALGGLGVVLVPAILGLATIDIGTPYDLRIATLEHAFRKKITTTTFTQDRDVLVTKVNASLSQCETLETRLHRLEVNLKQLKADRRLTQAGSA